MSTNPLEAMLLAGAGGDRFPPNSRYHATPIATLTLPDGRQVRYLRRRFVPQPHETGPYRILRIAQGDRIDNLAARLIGDPETYWRICDANPVAHPEELTGTPGLEIRIPSPGAGPGDEP